MTAALVIQLCFWRFREMRWSGPLPELPYQRLPELRQRDLSHLGGLLCLAQSLPLYLEGRPCLLYLVLRGHQRLQRRDMTTLTSIHNHGEWLLLNSKKMSSRTCLSEQTSIIRSFDAGRGRGKQQSLCVPAQFSAGSLPWPPARSHASWCGALSQTQPAGFPMPVACKSQYFSFSFRQHSQQQH